MKNNLLVTIALLFSINLIAQEEVRIWTSYFQDLDISEKENLDFRVSVYHRKEVLNKKSKTRFWARINKQKTMGFYKEIMPDTIIANDKWQKIELKGKIDKGAKKMFFGVFCENNGDFYFDNFKLEVKNKNGVWENVKIDNGGFENDSFPGLWKEAVFDRKTKKVKNFDIKRSKTNPYKGNYCLHIKGSNIIGNNNGKYVTVNNVKLYYEIYGSGEPLLLLHGNGQSIGAFINQVDVFKKQYKVIIVDCRGRGNSTFDYNQELTYTLEAEDIKLFLDKINIDKAHILGWSDGGIIGLIMAIKYPEKVGKLIAIGANINPEGLLGIQKLYDYIAKLEKRDKSNKNDLLIARYKLLVNYPKLVYKDLNVITAKTLFVAGDHDEIKTIHTVKMYEAIKNAQLAILPNETHYFPEQNPKFFNEIALKFLNSIDPKKH